MPFVALCALALALALYPSITVTAGRNGIQAAWERAGQSGAYHFSADIEQTTIPQPTVLNVGRASKQQSMHLEGETNLPDRQLHLTLWSQGGNVLNAGSGVEIKVDGDRAYARQGARDWEEVNNFIDVFAPQGDFMAYLSAARDVVEHPPETRPLPGPPLRGEGEGALPSPLGRGAGGEGKVTFTRYTFRIDGQSYATYLRDQMEKHLAAGGELPPGVDLDLPKQYVNMTGDGELWVGADGLPMRQILHLYFPPRPDDQEVRAKVTVDFSNFGNEQANLSRLTSHASRFTHLASLGILFLAFCAVLIANSRSRKLYIGLAVFLILSMVFSPLLQSVQAANFADQQAAKAREAEAREQESDMQHALNAILTESDHNPNLDPLAHGEWANERMANGRMANSE